MKNGRKKIKADFSTGQKKTEFNVAKLTKNVQKHVTALSRKKSFSPPVPGNGMGWLMRMANTSLSFSLSVSFFLFCPFLFHSLFTDYAHNFSQSLHLTHTHTRTHTHSNTKNVTFLLLSLTSTNFSNLATLSHLLSLTNLFHILSKSFSVCHLPPPPYKFSLSLFSQVSHKTRLLELQCLWSFFAQTQDLIQVERVVTQLKLI